jgi:hypothetical protein
VVAAEEMEAMRKIWVTLYGSFFLGEKAVKLKKLGNRGVCPLSSLHIQELAKVFIWLLRHFGTLSGTSQETSLREGDSFL